MAFQALNWKEKPTTPWGTSADFVPHRSRFWTQSSLGSVQIQYQTLDTNDSLGSQLPMLLDLSFHVADQHERGKSCGSAEHRVSNLLLRLWGQRECISLLSRFSPTWVASSLLPHPLISKEIEVHWQVLAYLSLRNMARKIVMFDQCKMGTFTLLPPQLAKWEGRLTYLQIFPKIRVILQTGYTANYHAGLIKLNIIIPSRVTFNFPGHNF